MIRNILTLLMFAALATILTSEPAHAGRAADLKEGKEMYFKGNYQYKEKDYRKAIMWYTRATKKGYPPAYYKLGLMYSQGRGTSINRRKGAQWFEKAANEGYHPAQYELGKMYERGLGVSQDIATAYMWYQLAVESGSRIAGRYLKAAEKRMNKIQLSEARLLLQKYKEKK